MAVDAYDADGTTNKLMARDAYSLALNYYDDGTYTDYNPIGAPKPNALAPVLPIGENHPLYNGNISSMAVNIRKLAAIGGGAPYAGPLLYNYRYDQLNRITQMDAFAAVNADYSNLTPLAHEAYKERVSYDPNGNILSYLRNGSVGKPAMDNLTYQYEKDANGLASNKLRYVFDKVAATNYSEDIDSQTPMATLSAVESDISMSVASDNYRYDEIGNLIYDKAGGINSITWTVYGKISTISKAGGINIAYTYDASGNRISKSVTKAGATTQTWYVRDATGNVMATYEKKATLNSGALSQTEVHLYGSSRLGVLNETLDCSNNNNGPVALSTGWDATLTRGQKFFELSNHLGNVLVTVTDRRVAVQAGTTGNVDYYLPDVATASDYYPFGMVMPGRSYSAGSGYRYGFNGKEDDKDISEGGQDYGMRVYDKRLGRFLSVDPLTTKYAELTPYQFASNTPIQAIDLDGLEAWTPSGCKNESPILYGPLSLNCSEKVGLTMVTVHAAQSPPPPPSVAKKPQEPIKSTKTPFEYIQVYRGSRWLDVNDAETKRLQGIMTQGYKEDMAKLDETPIVSLSANINFGYAGVKASVWGFTGALSGSYHERVLFGVSENKFLVGGYDIEQQGPHTATYKTGFEGKFVEFGGGYSVETTYSHSGTLPETTVKKLSVLLGPITYGYTIKPKVSGNANSTPFQYNIIGGKVGIGIIGVEGNLSINLGNYAGPYAPPPLTGVMPAESTSLPPLNIIIQTPNKR